MATSGKLPPPPPANGVITGPPKGAAGVNRKKQKRRAKQAAKAAQHLPAGGLADVEPADVEYDEDPLGYGEEDYEYSDAEPDRYHDQYIPPHTGTNGFNPPPPPPLVRKRNKKRSSVGHQHHAYNPDMLPPLPHPPPPPSGPLRAIHKGSHHVGNIWNTSTQQERQNIKDFWLSLSEEERKSLLKIEKEAVLRKMKQQQKHSCSCTVCGRKRTAIEEELEVLYEGYYEELEQYAHHDHPPLPSTEAIASEPPPHIRPPHPHAPSLSNPPQHHRTSHLHEHLDDDEEYSEDEEYSDEDEEYSDEELEPPRPGVPDFFNFGQNLTVKDNLLTVADDLLKNDGRKFIEMMEQLAERRMQRESEAEYAAAHPSHPGAYPPNDPAYNGEDPLAAGDEFDDDEGSYDSQEEYDDDMEEEDEMGGLTEEQRMQEGRRMFQIFAARMFEQRVLTAYREKVAAERQQKLLEELEDETKLEAQREAKKQRDAQKKKDKKRQQQQAKAEEKARKDAEKAAEEARAREAEEKKLEEQRRKKEEQRKKKEEEKRKQDEERIKKEADKARRAQEEQSRREEAERKAREQKAAEKVKKEEARKKERDERDAREKEAKERKVQEDREKKEREARVKVEKETREREKATQQAAHAPHHPHPQITKRPSQAGMVAVPGVYPKQTPSGISSPHPTIATPAIPKAPTPAKPRQTSQHGSHGSSPKQSHSQVSSVPSKSSSPGSVTVSQQPSAPQKTIMQKPPSQHPVSQHLQATTTPFQQLPLQPPPGMPHPQQHPGGFAGFGSVPPMGFPGFQSAPAPMMHGSMGQRGPNPAYQHQGGPMGVPNRMPFAPNMTGVTAPPPGMLSHSARGMPTPYDASSSSQPPPGFGQQHLQSRTSPIGPAPGQGPSSNEATRSFVPSHSRQPSASEKERFEPPVTHPIARPAPIQRPSSVKPQHQNRRGSKSEIDDLSKHLGSSALLADDDEPLPSSATDNRRHSNLTTGMRNGAAGGLGQLGGFGPSAGGFGTPGANWNTPAMPFGQAAGLGQQSWGGLHTPGIAANWSQNSTSFGTNSGFGSIGAATLHRPTGTSLNRPLTIRLAVCQACRQLSDAARGEGDGYHDVNDLLRRIEINRPMLDTPPSLREVEDICETEGDSQNGGGELHVRRNAGNDRFSVRWEPDTRTPDQGRGHAGGLGEIGSPMPTKTSPAAGFGAPGMGRSSGGFQSMGAVGSSNF